MKRNFPRMLPQTKFMCGLSSVQTTVNNASVAHSVPDLISNQFSSYQDKISHLFCRKGTNDCTLKRELAHFRRVHKIAKSDY
jgi:hypothetical protein